MRTSETKINRLEWRDIRLGQRFFKIYTEHGNRKLTVDYGRLPGTESA